MKWKITFTEEAIRDLLRLDRKTSKRIVKKLEEIYENPKRYLKKLVGYEDYKLKIGDYRVLVLLSEKKKEMIIEKVGHRKNIYKKVKK